MKITFYVDVPPGLTSMMVERGAWPLTATTVAPGYTLTDGWRRAAFVADFPDDLIIPETKIPARLLETVAAPKA